MNSYRTIATVSEKLQEILWEAFDQDSMIEKLIPTIDAIALADPSQTAQDSAIRLSVWCYRVEENPLPRKDPPPERPGAGKAGSPPQALDLYYLITPFAPSGTDDQVILGKAMQTLYDNASVQMQDESGMAWRIRINLDRSPLEHRTRLWEALRMPFRLSTHYQVQVSIAGQ